MEESSKTSKDLDTLIFPFLGSLEDGEPFEYLLLSIHSDFVEIAILEWLVNRTILHVGDKVDLYIPELLSEDYRFTRRVADTVVTAQHSNEMRGEIYRISLSKTDTCIVKSLSFDEFTHQLPSTILLTDLLISLIKDSLILKQGVRVYLKHLVPYFSRIVNFSHKEYVKLEEFFLHDVLQRIKDSEYKLANLYQLIREELIKPEQIPIYIDLESLRDILESEISLTLFNIVFAEKKDLNMTERLPSQTAYGFGMYINAIKTLEKRLYSNYNHIVLIYLKSLI